MKKTISFWVSTLIAIGCGICLYFCHRSGLLLEDSIKAACFALAMLALPFAASAIIGLVFDATVEGEDEEFELWKVTLAVAIAFPVLGIMLLESGLSRIFPINAKLVVDAQIALPLIINYLLTLWAIFGDKKNRPLYYSEEDYIRKKVKEMERAGTGTSTTGETPTDPYGRPTGRGY